ncbi:MAG: putative sulfate exporter family transporter [Candidatus Marinimicrobia bacterium]|nr:putative sulfate exporter family transporter [Candidatus Neomarinimicrobiota bacterium]|tara:strand:- start:4171 stop:5148 length:978 start_codon:yes stop_codon:yes gene_type:complete
MWQYKKIIPGLILTTIIALISIILSNYITIGAISISIIIGILIKNLFLKENHVLLDGISFSEKNILSFAIILLGSQLNLNSILLNYKIIILIILIIIITITGTYYIGKKIGLSKNISMLIAIGNGICGSAAIAGLSKILNSKKEDIGISITTINMLGTISIFIIPFFLINIFPIYNNEQMGFIIGTTIQAFGQVTATGFIINENVGEFSIIIKMLRILMLGPILIIINYIFNKNNDETNTKIKIPFFIIGFLLISIISSLGIMPDQIIENMKLTSKLLLAIAMAGIGLTISLKNLFNQGLKIISFSIISFSIQIVFIAMIALFFI